MNDLGRKNLRRSSPRRLDSRELLKLFTGTAGVPPANEREARTTRWTQSSLWRWMLSVAAR